VTRPWVGYYADDFTGATDTLEVLTNSGARTVLFVGFPDEHVRARYGDLDAIGLAGMSRSMTPEQMDSALPPVFEFMRALNPRVVHYKFCSTLDSSPSIGSIGRALDLGVAAFPGAFVPIAVGAPALGRYCAFGNLFARSGLDSVPFRLDRHPTMRHHPVTPMDESDIRVHLARQTDKRIALFDVLDLELPPAARGERLAAVITDGAEAVLLDTVYESHLTAVGRIIWETPATGPVLAFGSSGVEYALAAWWQESGARPGQPRAMRLKPASPILVVSGSCSPVTARQIRGAANHGFAVLDVDASALINPSSAQDAIERTVARADAALMNETSVIVHSCLGPEDPRIDSARGAAHRAGGSQTGGERIGAGLGIILERILDRSDVRRVVIAGGDTCGYVARRLPIEALEMIAPIAPGTPLCRAASRDARIDGMEFVFKGGQTGDDRYFVSLASERPAF
jgi:3-oxoisoapionate kinase